MPHLTQVIGGYHFTISPLGTIKIELPDKSSTIKLSQKDWTGIQRTYANARDFHVQEEFGQTEWCEFEYGNHMDVGYHTSLMYLMVSYGNWTWSSLQLQNQTPSLSTTITLSHNNWTRACDFLAEPTSGANHAQ